VNEEEFLSHIATCFPSGSSTFFGPGDDCALIEAPEGQLLVTVDTFTETVHFPGWTEPADLVSRCVAASLSDINAMGGVGGHIFVALGLPRTSSSTLIQYADELAAMARKWGLKVAGGDTVASPVRYMSMTVTGRLPAGLPPARRCGARKGDWIYLSGSLGGAAAGLALVLKGWRKKEGVWSRGEDHPSDSEKSALNAFLTPDLPYPLGPMLHGRGYMNACLDISDGLALDLERLCRASKVGAEINVQDIPRHAGAMDLAIENLLSSGEEFQLLWTSHRHLPFPTIGRVVQGTSSTYFDGSRKISIRERGYDHFSTPDQAGTSPSEL